MWALRIGDVDDQQTDSIAHVGVVSRDSHPCRAAWRVHSSHPVQVIAVVDAVGAGRTDGPDTGRGRQEEDQADADSPSASVPGRGAAGWPRSHACGDPDHARG
jgi:hypothetical protein